MGNNFETDNIVLLFDTYSADSQNLHKSFKLAEKNYPAIVIDDDGFLPDDVISVFGYFLGEFKKGPNVTGKPRYFNQIKVPKYWEISGNNSSGKVHNLSKERGRIFYAEPHHKRLIKIVDWYDEREVVRSSDHYNKHGALYARTIFNSKGQKVNKSYFSADGKEIIMENYVTKNIILNEGDKVRIFSSKMEFVLYFMQKTGYENCRVFFNTLSTSFFVAQRLNPEVQGDILFWQEPAREDIPGNMRIILDGSAARANKIMVQNKAAYDKLLACGANPDVLHLLGYIYPFKKENNAKKEALICTNSDRIAQCEKLVEALPDMHFHIVAITEMSSKLMSMDRYSNVSLFPGVKMHILEELFAKCDYYFDVNYESEIVSAVETAFLYNHLVYAFKETIHNPKYIAEGNIYGVDDVDAMIANVKAVMADENLLKERLDVQHATALLESKETYSNI